MTEKMAEETLRQWHELVKKRDPAGLDDILDEECVFHSPVVHTPQRGKKITRFYISAALQVLTNEHFRYVREVLSGDQAVLEFVTEMDGIEINGADLIQFNEQGKIIDFKVMIRPLQAVNLLHQLMGQSLESKKDG